MKKFFQITGVITGVFAAILGIAVLTEKMKETSKKWSLLDSYDDIDNEMQ